jgi:hypothetical protein
VSIGDIVGSIVVPSAIYVHQVVWVSEVSSCTSLH